MRRPIDDPSKNQFLLVLLDVEALTVSVIVIAAIFFVLRSVLA